MVDVEKWDQNLTDREVEKLSPAHKSIRSRTSLDRKVCLLEKWSSDRRLARKHEGSIPWKRPALRKWCDPAQGLWSWKFSPVDLPSGNNSDLMKRFEDVTALLRKVLSETPDAEFEALQNRVKVLEKQNLALLSQIVQLQRLIPRQVTKR